jgi:hypothetical protein
MNTEDAIAHHEQTLRLWEAIGREPVRSTSPGTERRRSPRFLVPERTCCIIPQQTGQEPSISATVRDVTSKGACLHGARPCALDCRVSVIPSVGEAMPPPVIARVTSCQPASTGYRIGVEFIEPDDECAL